LGDETKREGDMGSPESARKAARGERKWIGVKRE